MKKHILAGGAIAALALASVGTGLASAAAQQVPSSNGVEGCLMLSSPGGDTCSYVPTGVGGVLADGVSITVYYTVLVNGTPVPTQTTLPPFHPSDEGCVLWTSAASGATYTNVTKVTAQATSLIGVGFVGNPYPTQSPKQLPPCAGLPAGL